MSITKKAQLRLQRMLAGRVHRTQAVQRSPRPIVSFTFDDFPRTAWTAAGAMLTAKGLRATYYVAAGLVAQHSVMGPMCVEKDLAELVAAGHELGCHTLDHVRTCDISETELIRQCDANRRRVSELLNGYSLKHFSFPEGVVSPAAKRALASRYGTCRTIEPGINREPVDLHFLKANRLYARLPMGQIRALIHENASCTGWLVLYTHDVSSNPSEYGCTPAYFADVLNCVLDSGAAVLTIEAARQHYVTLDASPHPSGVKAHV